MDHRLPGTKTNLHQTKLIPVLYRDCILPLLLRNKSYLDLRTNQLDGFHKIKTFLLSKQPVPPTPVNQLPLRPPLFIGRELELAELHRRLSEKGSLVHVSGLAGKGKTTLALEFAHHHEAAFAAVYWLPCQSNSLSAIAGDLERQLGLNLGTDLATLVRDLKARCSQKRCLLIFDNVESDVPFDLVPGGAASVLVTTRHTNLRFLRGRHSLDLPLFTEAECFTVFRHELGAAEIDKNQPQCLQLFKRLGYLPIAINVAAALIREDIHYTIAGIAADLPADVTELIRTAIQALDESPRKLLAAMSACAPEGFALRLAAEIAGLNETSALDALQQLIARSLGEELSRADRRYRLHTLVRETADGQSLSLRHAQAIHRQFEKWETNWRQCEEDLADFQLAFSWARASHAANKEFPLQTFAYRGYALTNRIGRPVEACEICQHIARFSEEQNDNANLQVWFGNQALILKAWGRLDEALVLHKKEEAICLALGNQDSLQRSYGNQALILKAWGRLDEALALLKKQEEICLALGNQDSLQRSYGNQALILKAWGRLDEALALLKKEEEICLALGNQDGLWRSYGNQASIRQARGQLDDAFALIKKQEEICLALGSKEGLGHCYWSWGLLERALNHPEAEHAKLSAALAIFEKLKMPLELAAVKSELAKTRSASAS